MPINLRMEQLLGGKARYTVISAYEPRQAAKLTEHSWTLLKGKNAEGRRKLRQRKS